MMKKRSLTEMPAVFTLLAVLLLVHPAALWAGRPIENVEGSPIPQGLSDKQIQNAMISAGQTRGWIIKPVGAKHMQATIYIRSHMAKVDIRFDRSSYSIVYNDSENLDYQDGRIHRNYNKWVANLNMDIQRALAML
jgi:hypothetical protein